MDKTCPGRQQDLANVLGQRPTSSAYALLEKTYKPFPNLLALMSKRDNDDSVRSIRVLLKACFRSSRSSDKNSRSISFYLMRAIKRRVRSAGYDFPLACGPRMLVQSRGTSWVYSIPLQTSVQWSLGKELGIDLRTCSIATAFPRTFVTGGKKAYRTTDSCIEINHNSHTWQETASMNKSRQLHGAICVGGSLYVFGGIDDYSDVGMNSAEQLLINANQPFRTISNKMTHGRSSINPCRSNWKIYLALGGHASVEVFSILTQGFCCLTAKMPEQGPCLAVVDGEALILVTRVRRYRVITGTGAVEEVRHPLLCSSLQTNTVSELYEGFIYAVIQGEIWVISQENGERRGIVHNSASNNNKHSVSLSNTHVGAV